MASCLQSTRWGNPHLGSRVGLAPTSGHHDVGIGEDVLVDEPHFEADDTETVERSEVDDD